jgi:hypothetical protein
MSDASTDAASDGRSPFAADFPRDPALDALLSAFEAGNFARVREEAPRLVASASDPSIVRAAREILARTRPDPLARWVLVITGALLVALTAWWIAHDGPPSIAPAAPPVIEHVK